MSRSTYVQKTAIIEIWMVFVLSLQQMLCVGPTYVAPPCQTAPEPDFQLTMDWTWRPSQLACTITWL